MSDAEFETEEVSYAKDHVRDAMDDEFERQGVMPFDEDDNPFGIDLVDLASAVVNRLLDEGVEISPDIRKLHGA